MDDCHYRDILDIQYGANWYYDSRRGKCAASRRTNRTDSGRRGGSPEAADRILSTTSAPGSDRVLRRTIESVELSEDACDGNEEMEGLRYEGDL